MNNLTGDFILEMMTLYGIGVLGLFARKKGVLKKHTTEVLTQLILYITLPALILFSLDISFSFTIVNQFIWLVFMSILAMSIAIIISAWMGNRSNLPEHQRKVYKSLTIFGNQGFIGYAVIYILFHEQGIVYLTIFNIYYLILIWTYGIYLFTKDSNTINWKNIYFNPGILSTIAGLIILFTPLTLPNTIASSLESIGKMTIPLSMLVIGCLIADTQIKNIFMMLKNSYIWKSAFVKLLLTPLLLLPLYFLSVPFPLFATAIIVSGMPSAPTISLYAQKFGGDCYYASIGVLVTTFFCIFTIPILYFIVQLLYRYY